LPSGHHGPLTEFSQNASPCFSESALNEDRFDCQEGYVVRPRFFCAFSFGLLAGLAPLLSPAGASANDSLLYQALASNENEIDVDIATSWKYEAAVPKLNTAASNGRCLVPVSLILDQSIELNPANAFMRFVDQLEEGSWITGAEATFMDVDADSDGRITLSVVAPRVWVGRQFTPKWAVIVRYWEMSDSATTAPATPAGQVNLPNFATIQEFNQVELKTFDVEGVRSFTLWGVKLDAAVGGRHASYSFRNNIEAFGVFTTGNFVNMDLSNGGSFEGDGVTYGLTARKQIADLPAFLFVSGRGSSLIGTSDTFARAVGTVASSPSSPLVGAATVRRNGADANATIAEFQAGLQAEFELKYLPAAAFFRAAFEYQYWNVDARNVGGAGFGGTINDLTTNSFSRVNGDPSIKMLGLALATGLTW
jgi:hypothetical protein